MSSDNQAKVVKEVTKKKFQEMLNSWDRDETSINKKANEAGHIVDGWKNHQYHQRTRLYGDYLRSQDPDMFNDMYHRYITGYDQHSMDKYL